MSKTRRKFNREFKLRAIELSYERDSIADLANELGIRPELIYRWCSEFKSDKSGSFPGEGKESLSPEALEETVCRLCQLCRSHARRVVPPRSLASRRHPETHLPGKSFFPPHLA